MATHNALFTSDMPADHLNDRKFFYRTAWFSFAERVWESLAATPPEPDKAPQKRPAGKKSTKEDKEKGFALSRLAEIDETSVAAQLALAWLDNPAQVGVKESIRQGGLSEERHRVNRAAIAIAVYSAYNAWGRSIADSDHNARQRWKQVWPMLLQAGVDPQATKDIHNLELLRVETQDSPRQIRAIPASSAAQLRHHILDYPDGPRAKDFQRKVKENAEYGAFTDALSPTLKGERVLLAGANQQNWRQRIAGFPVDRPRQELVNADMDGYLFKRYKSEQVPPKERDAWHPVMLLTFPYFEDILHINRTDQDGPNKPWDPLQVPRGKQEPADLIELDLEWLNAFSEALASEELAGEFRHILDEQGQTFALHRDRLRDLQGSVYMSPPRNAIRGGVSAADVERVMTPFKEQPELVVPVMANLLASVGADIVLDDGDIAALRSDFRSAVLLIFERSGRRLAGNKADALLAESVATTVQALEETQADGDRS
jgi:hypothetical protein